MSACTQNSEPKMLISQTTPDEHIPTPPPCRWPALITLPTLAKFYLAWLHLCDVQFCPPACSSTPLWPSVHYPSISLFVNIIRIQTFFYYLNTLYMFEQRDLCRFEVKLELYGANARLVVSPPSLSPSHPPTPPRSR